MQECFAGLHIEDGRVARRRNHPRQRRVQRSPHDRLPDVMVTWRDMPPVRASGRSGGNHHCRARHRSRWQPSIRGLCAVMAGVCRA
jgi:hypothetical protein